jgi:hypothetical protein
MKDVIAEDTPFTMVEKVLVVVDKELVVFKAIAATVDEERFVASRLVVERLVVVALVAVRLVNIAEMALSVVAKRLVKKPLVVVEFVSVAFCDARLVKVDEADTSEPVLVNPVVLVVEALAMTELDILEFVVDAFTTFELSKLVLI